MLKQPIDHFSNIPSTGFCFRPAIAKIPSTGFCKSAQMSPKSSHGAPNSALWCPQIDQSEHVRAQSSSSGSCARPSRPPAVDRPSSNRRPTLLHFCAPVQLESWIGDPAQDVDNGDDHAFNLIDRLPSCLPSFARPFAPALQPSFQNNPTK